jgi:NDP-sugar pyrophosphorylase family protein
LNSKPVIVLAGGFGTRLQGILKGLPKPLADIKGTPFLKYLFLKLLEEGYDNFIVSLYYEADKIIEYIDSLKNGILEDSTIVYCVEPKPLGTGGAISYIVSELNLTDNFLVVNADTLLHTGYRELGASDSMAIGLLKVEDTSRYGKVEFDDKNRIVKFVEKKPAREAGYINAGVYNLDAQIFKNWNGINCSLETEIFPKLVANQQLKGIIIQSSFIDIGVPEDYYKFCSENKSK